MNEKTKTGLVILESAILLGVLGDLLLRVDYPGLNILLCVLGLSAALIMLVMRRKPEFWNKEKTMLHIALVFFSMCFAWRDSEQLLVADFLIMMTILAILTLPALKVKIHLAGVSHYAIGWIWSGLSVAFAPLFLVFGDIKWTKIPQTGWTKHLIAVLRGLAIVAPILLIFTALFMAADAVFQGIIEKTFRISPDILFSHLVLIGFISWVTAGYFRGSLFDGFGAENEVEKITLDEIGEIKTQPLSVTHTSEQPNEAPKETPKEEPKKTWTLGNFDNSILPNWATLGAIEICIVLGLINLLFLSFVIVQIPYLFGGFELVQQTDGLKLADYARRGFGELVTVAALVLPILLTSHWLLRKDNAKNEFLFRILAGIQIMLLFVIMASAAQRLLVLTGNLGYGLSTVRFYPMVFMMWLTLVFLWFGVTVLRGVRANFAWGAFWLAAFMLASLHFFNPDDFIARTNIRLMQEGRTFDGYYHTKLSADAYPILMESFPLMNEQNKCYFVREARRKLNKPITDFRSWNYSREVAYEKINETAATVMDMNSCKENYPNYSDANFR